MIKDMRGLHLFTSKIDGNEIYISIDGNELSKIKDQIYARIVGGQVFIRFATFINLYLGEEVLHSVYETSEEIVAVSNNRDLNHDAIHAVETKVCPKCLFNSVRLEGIYHPDCGEYLGDRVAIVYIKVK